MLTGGARGRTASWAILLLIVFGAGGCTARTLPAGGGVPIAGAPECRPADLGQGTMAWLDNDLAQIQLWTVAELVDQVDGVLQQTIDAGNRRAVLLFDPARVAKAEVETLVVEALADAIASQRRWRVEHAEWLAAVRAGGGDLTPEEREVLLGSPGRQGSFGPDQPLAVEVRAACGDPDELAALSRELLRPGVTPQVDYSVGIVRVRVAFPDPEQTQRVLREIEARYGDRVEVSEGVLHQML